MAKNCHRCTRAAGGKYCRRMYSPSTRCSHFERRTDFESAKKPEPQDGKARYLQYLPNDNSKGKKM